MCETGCVCAEPGWCERHNVLKSPHMHKLCQSRADYFALWESGRGPGQVVVPSEQVPPGVGTTLRKMLGCNSGLSSDFFWSLNVWGVEKCLAMFQQIVETVALRVRVSPVSASRLVRRAISDTPRRAE